MRVPLISLIVIISLTTPGCFARPKHWVLIAAGSKTYDNYRHQANACHAYHIFLRNGVPKDQIILMMYDDVAHNHQNPHRGTLINKPNGTDVYGGCQIDYRHWEVTPTHFLHALKGDKKAMQKLTGRKHVKVIESGPNDHIFVTFTDHGAEGLVGFPNIADLHASEFQKAIEWMHDNKRFAHMVLYIEACESGSMFEGFRTDMNVYAVSSTNRTELGFACYFDEERNVFLSDTYSAAWMEDSDRGQLKKETFTDQFKVAFNRSSQGKNKSHPHQFGNVTIASSVLAQFQAGVKGVVRAAEDASHGDSSDSVSADMVVIETLKRKLQKYPSKSFEARVTARRLAEEYMMQSAADVYLEKIAKQALRGHSYSAEEAMTRGDSRPMNVACYKAAIAATKKFCPGQANDRFYYVFRKYYVLSKLCNVASYEEVVDAVISTSERTGLCHRQISADDE